MRILILILRQKQTTVADFRAEIRRAEISLLGDTLAYDCCCYYVFVQSVIVLVMVLLQTRLITPRPAGRGSPRAKYCGL